MVTAHAPSAEVASAQRLKEALIERLQSKGNGAELDDKLLRSIGLCERFIAGGGRSAAGMARLKEEVKGVLTNATPGHVALHKVSDKHHKRRDGEQVPSKEVRPEVAEVVAQLSERPASQAPGDVPPATHYLTERRTPPRYVDPSELSGLDVDTARGLLEKLPRQLEKMAFARGNVFDNIARQQDAMALREQLTWVHETRPAMQARLKSDWDSQIAVKRALDQSKADAVAAEAARIADVAAKLKIEEDEKRRKRRENLQMRGSIYLGQAADNQALKAAAKAQDDVFLAQRQSLLAAEWQREQTKLAAARQAKLDRGAELRGVMSQHSSGKERAATEQLAADRGLLETRAKMMDEADRTRYRMIEDYKERAEQLYRLGSSVLGPTLSAAALEAERRAEREQQEAEARFLATQAEKRARAQHTKTALIAKLGEQVAQKEADARAHKEEKARLLAEMHAEVAAIDEALRTSKLKARHDKAIMLGELKQAVITERQQRLDAVVNPVNPGDVWVHRKVLEGGRAFNSLAPHFSMG